MSNNDDSLPPNSQNPLSAHLNVSDAIIPGSDIFPWPGNYVNHPRRQIMDLQISLHRFGQVQSIVVWERGKDGENGYWCVAGHGITQAGTSSAMHIPEWEPITEFSCRVIAHDAPEASVIAYLAADNELARGGDPDRTQLARLTEEVERQMGRELAATAAGGSTELELLRLEQEIQEEMDKMLAESEQGETRMTQTMTKDRSGMVRVTVSVPDLPKFEEAILATGETNRGTALLVICLEYLKKVGSDSGGSES